MRGLVDGDIGLDGDDVDARDHDLAHGRLREVEDGAEHLALVLLEDAFLAADLDHQAQFILRDEWGLVAGLAAEELDQAVRDPGEEGDEGTQHDHQPLDRRDQHARPALRRAHRRRLRRDLTEDQHNDREDDCRGNLSAVEIEVHRDQRGDGRSGNDREVAHDEDRCDEEVRLAHQTIDALGGAVALLRLLADANAIDRGQRGLGGGGKPRDHQRQK